MSAVRGVARRLRPRSLPTLVMIGVAIIVAGIAGFMWLYFPLKLESEALSSAQEKGDSMADMAAFTLAAALVFDDTVAVLEVIEALQVDSLVAYVEVLHEDGRVIASSWRTAEPFQRARPGRPNVSADLLEVASPILSGQQSVGTVLLGLDLVPLRRAATKTRRDVALLALAVFATGLAAVALLGAFIRQVEARREQLEEQLLHSQKMEAVGRLAGGVAHDFNNLLTTINGTAALALETLPADSPGRTDMLEILTAGQRAAALTGQLLAFSRRQMRRPTLLNLNAVIRETATMLERLIGETIRLQLDLSQPEPCVQADPGQITQVLMNLVLNARDAMPDGGVLRIRTDLIDVDPREAGAFAVPEPGRYALLEVEDTGHGMDEPTLAVVFEPFFTTKEVGKGTGLGLATVYGIAEQNGGTVTCTSRPGDGATFVVLLPAHEGGESDDAAGLVAAGSTMPPAEPIAAPGGRETVLLVEDEEPVRGLLARVLRRSGYDVLQAFDGAHGLEVEGAYGGTIDALVTDVIMPELSGPVLAAAVLERRPDMKVVYMSGYTRDEVLPAGTAASGCAFLSKPMSPGDLIETLRRVLDGQPEVAPGTPLSPLPG